jgi:hypothetical protein
VKIIKLYLPGAMAFGAVAWKAIAIGAAAYTPMVMRIAPQPVAVPGTVLPRGVRAVGRNHYP